jgi:hypothetical protein
VEATDGLKRSRRSQFAVVEAQQADHVLADALLSHSPSLMPEPYLQPCLYSASMIPRLAARRLLLLLYSILPREPADRHAICRRAFSRPPTGRIVPSQSGRVFRSTCGGENPTVLSGDPSQPPPDSTIYRWACRFSNPRDQPRVLEASIGSLRNITSQSIGEFRVLM